MQSHFPAFPSLFDPPVDIVRLLRDVDPAADLLYFGWGKWSLVRLKPNRLHIQSATRALSSGVRMLDEWRHNQTWKANPGAFRRLYGRYLYWTAVRLGARPVAEYTRREIRAHGLEYIVDDFRRMEWMYRRAAHIDDAAGVDVLFNRDYNDGVASSRAALADESLALSIVTDNTTRGAHSVTSNAPANAGRSSVRTSAPSLQRSFA